jgi:TatD DNase family protein
MFFDSHAHLSHISTQRDITAVLEGAERAGVRAIIDVCTSPEEVEIGLQIQEKYPSVYLIASTTPHDAAERGEQDFSAMEQYSKKGVLVGIGETGLDYHYYADTKEAQQHYLRRYLQLACHSALPIIIHCREAFADLFTIIDAEYEGGMGLLHCFTGTEEEAEELVQRGWYLSFSGIVTFPKNHALQDVARRVPLERMLIETDAPYLAPIPYRGKSNEPAYLRETAAYLAALRGISLEELAAATDQNATTFFGISTAER